MLTDRGAAVAHSHEGHPELLGHLARVMFSVVHVHACVWLCLKVGWSSW